MVKTTYKFIATCALFLTTFSQTALAELPENWQLGFQKPASPIKEDLVWLHNDVLMPIITSITVLVFILLVYCCVRYNHRRNAKASNTSHNTLIEIVWTAIPVIILLVIALPSFKILYAMDKAPNPEMTLKVTGYQWYWGYEYPDHDGLTFESYMINDEDLKEGDVRLLSTDNEVVLPVDTEIRILITAADVLHSWAMPAFGIKKDAIPGRLNETWVKINRPGVYYGQCSEICGTGHGFMPIMVRAVSKPEFEAWIKKAKKEFAAMPPSTNYITASIR